MNKKAFIGIGLKTIIGLVILLLVISATVNAGIRIFGGSVSGSDSDTLEELFSKLEMINETNPEIVANLEIQQNDALIIFNPESDFKFISSMFENNEQQMRYLNPRMFFGHSLQRTQRCSVEGNYMEGTCVCLCKDISFISGDGLDVDIDCANRVCKNSNKFMLPEKIVVSDVFGLKAHDPSTSWYPQEYNINNDFWLNSFIIVRSENLNPDNKRTFNLETNVISEAATSRRSAPIVAGYRDFAPLRTVDVTLKFVEQKDNKSVVTFCITGNC